MSEGSTEISMATIRARLAQRSGARAPCNDGATVSRETGPDQAPATPWRANVVPTWDEGDLLWLYLLRFYSDLTTAEIGARMGRSDAAVRGKLHRKGWLTQPHRARMLPGHRRRSTCR